MAIFAIKSLSYIDFDEPGFLLKLGTQIRFNSDLDSQLTRERHRFQFEFAKKSTLIND